MNCFQKKKKVKCYLHLKTVKKTQFSILFNGKVLSIVGFILGCLIPHTTSFARPLFSGLEKFKRVKKLIMVIMLCLWTWQTHDSENLWQEEDSPPYLKAYPHTPWKLTKAEKKLKQEKLYGILFYLYCSQTPVMIKF